MTAGTRYSNLEIALGKDIFSKIKKTKVLVVGAGGIGCELLKNLVMTGFLNIEVVWIDCWDTHNTDRLGYN